MPAFVGGEPDTEPVAERAILRDEVERLGQRVLLQRLDEFLRRHLPRLVEPFVRAPLVAEVGRDGEDVGRLMRVFKRERLLVAPRRDREAAHHAAERPRLAGLGTCRKRLGEAIEDLDAAATVPEPARLPRVRREPLGEPLLLRVARLREDAVPDLVRVLDPHATSGGERGIDKHRHLGDERLVGEMRHAEPRLGTGLVRQFDHHLKRHADLEAPSRVAWQRSIVPRCERRVVGPRPVHEAQHAVGLEPREKLRREGRRRRARLLGKVDRLGNHPDVAQMVRGIGGGDIEEQPAARGRVHLHHVAAGHALGVDPRGAAGVLDRAHALVAHHPTPAADAHGGVVDEHDGAGDLIGQQRTHPAVLVEIEGPPIVPLPRRRVAGDPRAARLEEVGEGHRGAPVDDCVEIRAEPRRIDRR